MKQKLIALGRCRAEMDFFKPVKYHGLVNQGATCYLNSVLQVLFMTEDFRQSVYKNDSGKEHIDRELRDLFTVLEKRKAYTSKITKKLKIKDVGKQSDAAEHFEKILRLTSTEASKIFHGELINRNKCQMCGTIIESPAGFWSLPLSLVNYSYDFSVEMGLEDFFRPSKISGDNQMYCETCDEKCDALLDCVVTHHPEVLALLLKRFEFDYTYMSYVKINQPVDVPETLLISGNQLYHLYAIVEHSGELRYGHYISIIRSQRDDKWYMFNDTTVVHCDFPRLERSQAAYLLFYRKQETKEKPEPCKRKRNDKDEQDDLLVLNKKPNLELNNEEEGLDQKGQKTPDLDPSLSSNEQTCVPNGTESSECKANDSEMEVSDLEQPKAESIDLTVEHEFNSEIKPQFDNEIDDKSGGDQNSAEFNPDSRFVCGPDVCMTTEEQEQEKVDVMDKGDSRFESQQRTGSEINASVKSMKRLTKYDLYLASLNNNYSQIEDPNRDKERSENPQGSEHKARYKQERLADVSGNAHTNEERNITDNSRRQVMFGMESQSSAVIKDEPKEESFEQIELESQAEMKREEFECEKTNPFNEVVNSQTDTRQQLMEEYSVNTYFNTNIQDQGSSCESRGKVCGDNGVCEGLQSCPEFNVNPKPEMEALKNNTSQSESWDRGEQRIENPPAQSDTGTDLEYCCYGEHKERFKQERSADVSSDASTSEERQTTDYSKNNVKAMSEKFHSCVMIKKENEDIIMITLKKRQNVDKTTE